MAKVIGKVGMWRIDRSKTSDGFEMAGDELMGIERGWSE